MTQQATPQSQQSQHPAVAMQPHEVDKLRAVGVTDQQAQQLAAAGIDFAKWTSLIQGILSLLSSLGVFNKLGGGAGGGGTPPSSTPLSGSNKP